MIINLTLLIVPIVSGMKFHEDLEFIKFTSIWRKGIDFHLDNCLFYSFGYDKRLPYTKIDLSLEKDIEINIKINAIEAPSGCSIVLIAGKYVNQVDAVMKRMDDIAEQTQFVPLAAFIFDENAEINLSARFVSKKMVGYDYIYAFYFRNDYSPTMVTFTLKSSVIIPFIRYMYQPRAVGRVIFSK